MSVAEKPTNLDCDILKELRDYCVRHEIPLPTIHIDIVKKHAAPDVPEFVACCSVASIVRFGKSIKKRDAVQRAAVEMLAVISNKVHKLHFNCTKPSKEVPKTDDGSEFERRKKFKTYRELTDTGMVDSKGLRLCDRHKYFNNLYPSLKEAAFMVIRSDEYTSSKDKALSLLSALKITPSISLLKSISNEPLTCVELNCDFDVVFVALESEIYDQVIEYLRNMLI
ncbi:uncharacterized protein LOC119546082 [Drosophila subpulchrella]|uniref:uncharacterized protein LOC119546082 n=1 Tax=Drosophila subpulchrella TaxID=1486046 RepID=UPI0018A196B7|nr:uncharacterized protein LOC119546082 [Drosophila subpulchrella]